MERKYGKYTIEINFGFDYVDDNPRLWAQGVLYGIDNPIEEFEENKDEIEENSYIFPIYKYEHGMVAFHIGHPTHKDFDIGFYGIYAVPKSIGGDNYQAEEIAKCELKEWECYCNGTIYEYHIFDEDFMIDEYHGGYFSEEACLADALVDAKYYTERDEKDAVNYWASHSD